MPIHRDKGFLQAFAAFAVETGNAGTQLGDRFIDVGAFLVQRVVLAFKFGKFVLGLQVDTAKPLAVRAQARQLAFGFVFVDCLNPGDAPRSLV